MNSTLKNILLTIIISLCLLFIGYSLSCFIAYLIGWPPFVSPLIFTILSLIAILVGLIWNKLNGGLEPIFFLIFISLFLSSLTNTIIQGVKFEDHEYRGSILGSNGYLYNQWGYKILDIEGKIRYDDFLVYVETQKQIIALDYSGNLLAIEEFIIEEHRGRAYVLHNQFTDEYLIRAESSLIKSGYEDYVYLGESEKSDYFKCYRNGLWDLIRVGKKYGWEIEYKEANDIEYFGNPIRCLVIKDGRRYKILASEGSKAWIVKNGVNYPYWDEDDYRLYYYDDDGEKWHCQLEY